MHSHGREPHVAAPLACARGRGAARAPAAARNSLELKSHQPLGRAPRAQEPSGECSTGPDASVCSPLPDEVSALDEGSIHDRGASPVKQPRDFDGEAEDDVSDLGSPRVILDDDVSELTEARA